MKFIRNIILQCRKGILDIMNRFKANSLGKTEHWVDHHHPKGKSLLHWEDVLNIWKSKIAVVVLIWASGIHNLLPEFWQRAFSFLLVRLVPFDWFQRVSSGLQAVLFTGHLEFELFPEIGGLNRWTMVAGRFMRYNRRVEMLSSTFAEVTFALRDDLPGDRFPMGEHLLSESFSGRDPVQPLEPAGW
jgi:hypothetical protein